VPRWDGDVEPLHAVYRVACAPAIEASLRAGRHALRDFLAVARVDYVAEAELRGVRGAAASLINVNTPEELAAVGAAGLYGLYRGVPRTAFGADHVPIPSVITLYRGPLQRRWRGTTALVHGVEETLRHELAHHLGISDARLDELHGGG
jgi:predicted Zn-dependent protease with MMP-like domain